MFIAIFLTPFHLEQFKTVVGKDEDGIFFISDDISDEYVQSYIDLKKVIRFQKKRFSKKEFFKNPVKKLLKYRKGIKEYKEFINQYIKKFILNNEISTLYIFNDKDVFVQIFMSELKKLTKCNIIAIDEGVGFYLKYNWKDRILTYIYPFFCFLLFGFPYRYYKALGTSHLIDILYVRVPEWIYGKRKSKILKIERKPFIENIINFPTNQVLILTSPLSEEGYLSAENEIKLIKKIIDFLINENYIVSIKPHPIENETKYDFIKDYENIKLLKKEIVSEKLNYFEYRYIINFGSSSIFDIVLSGYPSSHIITIDTLKIANEIPLFVSTKIINYYDKESDIEEKIKKALLKIVTQNNQL
jgi:hypothetical protein